MNKLILTVASIFMFMQLYAQETETLEMRKRKVTFLSEAELTPTSVFKGRGLSLTGAYNFTDQISIGIGLNPHIMFFPDENIYYDYLITEENGEIKHVSEKIDNPKNENKFCMPLFFTVKSTFSKHTNASPFIEIRIGKDAVEKTEDLYRAVTVGARFGFRKDYSKAINVALGWRKNDIPTIEKAYALLFKIGYEF
ncbi:MAG: hypothetical protein IIU11_04255 [Bacteroidales bacterium]|jgi:uncharacterized C2H2 Zn-finger protein|nr:hypothetical protein [Bacteroidales bacterium]MBR6277528.1 hypothetical protein [Bacteroidales bacterium]